MKTVVPAQTIDGVVVPRHEIEVVCANCEDPVSEQEASLGTCTACGQPWSAKQNIAIHATTIPAAGAKTM